MASFRSGIKIFGELSMRQRIGRLRSFSEDRKPGQWLPEDQWAVRHPCTTCPDPKKKPPKPSRSWLSICRDPQPPLTCDIRHNNCPPPEEEEPWYAFLTKKKPVKPKPPLNACKMELQKEAENPTEEVCEDMDSYTWPEVCEQQEPPEPIPCEVPPAPVIRLSCPPPKDLDLMLWCGRPGLSVSRIASQCQTDRMPYEEFRPPKYWKPPPYSLPCKKENSVAQPFCSNVGRAPLAEYKQVDIPKPLYTRYKSVELEDENFLMCMTDAKCPPEEGQTTLPHRPPPPQKPKPPPQEECKPNRCPERRVIVAASLKPYKLRCAPKFKFRPKPTKLVERKTYRNPCANYKACNLKNLAPPCCEEEDCPQPVTPANPCSSEQPKVITGTLTDEPQTYERNLRSKRLPHWMYMIGKPGSKDTPLVPHVDLYPNEPDCSAEADGLRFYDGKDEGIHPKPPPDPCFKKVANKPAVMPAPPPEPEPTPPPPPPPPLSFTEKFVLMPDEYNIRNMRPTDKTKTDLQEATFQEFIDAKTSNIRNCSKLYPQMKENILYDLIRNCPVPPPDASKIDLPPRRAPPGDCPQRPSFHYAKRYSTLAAPVYLRKPDYAKVFNRMKSDDSRNKCKARSVIPKPRECPPPVKGPSCEEMELPCCPKASIPPRCDVKRPLPVCKKKLAPKPSYSECSKDPPPCLRITECNAWEKRDLENARKGSKNRKFSNWAAQPNISGSVELAEQTATEEVRAGGSPPRPGNSAGFVGRGHSRIRRRTQKQSPKIMRKSISGKELMMTFVNPTEDTNSYYKSDSLVGRRKPPERRQLKTAPTEAADRIDPTAGTRNQVHERKVISALLQDHHTRNEVGRAGATDDAGRRVTGGAAVIGSIGSWINGLVKAQRKKSNSCPPSPSSTYVQTVDVDRLMKLTKPFRDRLRSASSEAVQCSHLVTDPPGGNLDHHRPPSPFRRLMSRNRIKLPNVYSKMRRERARSSMWRLETLSPNVNLTDRHLQKEPSSRMHFRKLEEYSVPPVENLTGRTLLLNVDGPVQLRNQYSSGRDRSETGLRSQFLRPGKAQSPSKKSISRFSVASRGASTFTRTITRKSISKMLRDFGRQVEPPSQAEILRALAKKAKEVNVIRPSMGKKSRSTEGAIVPSGSVPNTKFRQSATSSLVTSGLANMRESDVRRNVVCRMADLELSRCAAVVPLVPRKPPGSKAARWDKPVKPKKWLPQPDDRKWKLVTKSERDAQMLQDDLKYSADKCMKRQEARNALLRLESKKKSSEKARKEEAAEDKIKGGRFGWQHALFRSSTRYPGKTVDFDPIAFDRVRSLLDVREATEAAKEARAAVSESDIPKKLTNNLELYDSDVEEDRSETWRSEGTSWTGEEETEADAESEQEDEVVGPAVAGVVVARSIEASRRAVRTAGLHTAGQLGRRFPEKDGGDGCKQQPPCEKKEKESENGRKTEVTKSPQGKSGKKKEEPDACRWESAKKPGPNCPDG